MSSRRSNLSASPRQVCGGNADCTRRKALGAGKRRMPRGTPIMSASWPIAGPLGWTTSFTFTIGTPI